MLSNSLWFAILFRIKILFKIRFKIQLINPNFQSFSCATETMRVSSTLILPIDLPSYFNIYWDLSNQISTWIINWCSRKRKQVLTYSLGIVPSWCQTFFAFVVLNSSDQLDSFNFCYRFWSEAYETMRCEFFWPWNGEDTWRGMKEGFSFTLMVLGLFVIFRNLFPSVADGCPTPSIDLGSIFSKHGELHHPALPPI